MNLKPLVLTLLPFSLLAHTQHGVHEHGFGQLNLAISGQQLALELFSPAADIVGFEHNPVTSEERATFADALQKAQDADALFTLPASAGCVLQQAQHIENNEHAEHGHNAHDEHEHEHEHHDEHAHKDIKLSYSWQCSQPDALNQLNAAGLFQQFPSFNRISLQGIAPDTQIAATLTPEQPQANW
ncbi:DUF2796 domain-containing protein [Oceanimonas baumannii]|uniref:DUF2796 domain-containing protein n=1 Tax=Oceanimonas baumannii TaxID=129578 RepID=UPI003A931ABE